MLAHLVHLPALHRRVSPSFPSVAAFCESITKQGLLVQTDTIQVARTSTSASARDHHRRRLFPLLLSFWCPTKGHFVVTANSLRRHTGLAASPIDNRSAECACRDSQQSMTLTIGSCLAIFCLDHYLGAYSLLDPLAHRNIVAELSFVHHSFHQHALRSPFLMQRSSRD